MPINAEGASRNLQIRIEKGNRRAKEKGTQFTCFTSTKVQILTRVGRVAAGSQASSQRRK